MTISQRRRHEIMRRDNFRCRFCGAGSPDGVRLEIDHKVPRSRGGSNDDANLWTLCGACNAGKKNHHSDAAGHDEPGVTVVPSERSGTEIRCAGCGTDRIEIERVTTYPYPGTSNASIRMRCGNGHQFSISVCTLQDGTSHLTTGYYEDGHLGLHVTLAWLDRATSALAMGAD